MLFYLVDPMNQLDGHVYKTVAMVIFFFLDYELSF